MTIQEEIKEDTGQLVTIPPNTALAVFTTEKAMEPFMARIRQEVDAFVPDVTTVKGRKAIASMAHIITKTKTYLDGVGKELNDAQKEIPKKIDAARKAMRDTLDQWKDEVRQPLTDYEAAEETRITKHTATITSLNDLSRFAAGRDSAGLQESIALVEQIIINPANCEEFEEDYARAKTAALESLQGALKIAIKHESDQAELAQLRQKNLEREAADRDEKIRKDAAAQATKDAEAASQKALDEEKAKTAAAEALARKATEDAARAQQKTLDDAAAAKRLADQQKAREAADAMAREKDQTHRKKINNAAVEALIKGGIKESIAKDVVKLIALKKIPAITISY